jgi:hypothetical protein
MATRLIPIGIPLDASMGNGGGDTWHCLVLFSSPKSANGTLRPNIEWKIPSPPPSISRDLSISRQRNLRIQDVPSRCGQLGNTLTRKREVLSMTLSADQYLT